WVSVKRHIREPPRKEGATGPSLAGRVKATSFSPSSGLSCRIVAGVQDPETNIGTFSWTKAASASVSFQVAAAAVEALCSRARSAYHVRPSTASGALMVAFHCPPCSSAISPPAPQTKEIAGKMLAPSTGKEIQSG